mmetsp:Transcript_45531/g.120824  ORF Transcript_45531/g.120824 Transcript_45531/m.120824 type:complete len:133 (-) Transcript_45531:162-560(-)
MVAGTNGGCPPAFARHLHPRISVDGIPEIEMHGRSTHGDHCPVAAAARFAIRCMCMRAKHAPLIMRRQHHTQRNVVRDHCCSSVADEHVVGDFGWLLGVLSGPLSLSTPCDLVNVGGRTISILDVLDQLIRY